MKRQRIYIDTSVVGGCFDPQFAEWSEALFAKARQGALVLLVSDLLLDELRPAPLAVRQVVPSLSGDMTESIETTREAEELAAAYLAAEVVGRAAESDANHVALATVARADLILSWNFRHFVHLQKVRGFNAVNLRLGYPQIDIRSPREVV